MAVAISSAKSRSASAATAGRNNGRTRESLPRTQFFRRRFFDLAHRNSLPLFRRPTELLDFRKGDGQQRKGGYATAPLGLTTVDANVLLILSLVRLRVGVAESRSNLVASRQALAASLEASLVAGQPSCRQLTAYTP